MLTNQLTRRLLPAGLILCSIASAQTVNVSTIPTGGIPLAPQVQTGLMNPPSQLNSLSVGINSGGTATSANAGIGSSNSSSNSSINSSSSPAGSTPTQNTVNRVDYRLTSGGTFVPGYGPSGGYYGLQGSVGGQGYPVEPNAPRLPEDLSLGKPTTHLEALDGLVYTDTLELEHTIRKWQLVDAMKILPMNERRTLRAKILDSPVATGNQNILTSFLRNAELIEPKQLVVGLIPRRNLVLIGLRSSEEQ